MILHGGLCQKICVVLPSVIGFWCADLRED